MPSVRISNPFADIANSIARFRQGKAGKEDQQRKAGIEDRMASLREADSARADEGLGLQRDQLQLQRENIEADNSRAAAEQARTAEKDAQEEAARGSLIQRIQQLDPKIGNAVDNFTHDDLRAQLGMLEQRRTTLQATEMAHRQQQSDMVLQARRAQDAANSNLAVIKRARDDAIKRINSDPSLMREYAKLLQAKAPNALGAMIKAISNGRDLGAEYMAAGQQSLLAGQTVMQLSGVGGAGQSPSIVRTTNQNLPYQLLDPQTQQGIATEIAARMKAGQAVDVQAMLSRGVPIDSIAQSVGVTVDPMTGNIAPLQAAPAAVGSTPDFFGARDMMARLRPSGAPPTQPASPSTFQQPTQPATAVSTAAAAAPKPGASAAVPGAPTPAANASAPAITPPAGMNVPGADSPAMQSLSAQRQGRNPAQFGITPAPDLASGFPQGHSNGPMGRSLLQAATSVPAAEQAARALLDSGDDYDGVVQNIPMQFRSLVAAKLPKRIPVSPMTNMQPSAFGRP